MSLGYWKREFRPATEQRISLPDVCVNRIALWILDQFVRSSRSPGWRTHVQWITDRVSMLKWKGYNLSCILQTARQLIRLKNERPTWCHLLFYFTSYVLNMFRTLTYPSSGACDCVVELPHRSSCSQFVVCWRFGAAGFWVVFVLQAEAQQSCGNSTTQSQAPEDGYINVRNMLST